MNQQPPPGYPPEQQPHHPPQGQPAAYPPAQAPVQQQQRPFGSSGGGARPFGAPSGRAAPAPKARPVQAEQTFTYEYTVLKVTATLDPMTLTVKQGLRTFRVNVQQIKYLYVRKMPDGQILLITEELPNGKTKLTKLYADSYAPGFQQLVDVLVATRPSADIRSMPVKEALRTMGTSDKTWLVAIMVTLLPTALIAVALLPKLVHAIDFGEETVTVQQLEQGKEPASRNLVITDAHPLFNDSIKVTHIHRRNGVETNRTYTHLVPLVPSSVKSSKGHTIYVVLETGNLTIREQVQMQMSNRFEGVLRDALWEGIDGDDRDYFEKNIGVDLADDAKLVELGGEHLTDMLIFFSVTGGTFVLLGLFMTLFWYKLRAK